MLVKSLVAGTVLTLLAGGVVYYGTDVDGTLSTKSLVESSQKILSGDKKETTDDDAGTDDISESESSSDIPSIKTADNNLIDPQSASEKRVETAKMAELQGEEIVKTVPKPEMKKAEMKEESAETETKEVTSKAKPSRKWIDQYLKSEPASASENEEASESKEEEEQTIQQAEVKTEIADDRKPSTIDKMIDEEMEIELFSEDNIRDAEAKGFKDRAKQIDNIWVGEEGSETDPVTLHEIMKNHDGVFKRESEDGDTKEDDDVKNVEIDVMKDTDGTMTTKTETIDMGDGKVMKIVTKKHISKSDKSESYGSGSNGEKSYGSGSDDHKSSEKKIRIKVMNTDESNDEITSEIIDMKDGKRIKIRKKMAKSPQAHSHPDPADTGDGDKGHTDKTISQTAKLIMEQAEKISIPELRDRAYLDLVSYALKHGDKTAAKMALSKIEQVELRDTARNRMAVNYAKNGDAEKAFGILENLEVDALRDVMRLQVIEALIAPETNSETKPAQDMQ